MYFYVRSVDRETATHLCDFCPKEYSLLAQYILYLIYHAS